MPYIDNSELSTVLAALRQWQVHTGTLNCGDAVNDIATNFGKDEPLSDMQIDALRERLSTSAGVRRVVIDASGGCFHASWSDGDGVEILIYDDDTDGCDVDESGQSTVIELDGREYWMSNLDIERDPEQVERVWNAFSH